jgi:hypothetical protein
LYYYTTVLLKTRSGKQRNPYRAILHLLLQAAIIRVMMDMDKKNNYWLLPAGLLALTLTLIIFLARGAPSSGANLGAGARPARSETTAGAQVAPAAATAVATPIAPPRPVTPTPVPTPTPDDVNPLTGRKVNDKALLRRRPLLVRIGNDPQIRPQSGLAQADVVYEELIDGYPLTRLSAIFLSNDPPLIGPIRSARIISIQLARQYQAALIHSGASDPIRWEISQVVPVDLDEYFHPKPYYSDDSKDWRGRLFTSAKVMRAYMRENEMEAAVNLPGFVFSEEGDLPPGSLAATSVVIPYPEGARVEWKYSAARGRYFRFVAGRPFTDAASGEQIAAANVVVYYAEHQPTDIVEDAGGATSLRIIIEGEGQVKVIRDGLLFAGRWRTPGDRPPQFVTDDGRPIPLKSGNTWIEVVPTEYLE